MESINEFIKIVISEINRLKDEDSSVRLQNHEKNYVFIYRIFSSDLSINHESKYYELKFTINKNYFIKKGYSDLCFYSTKLKIDCYNIHIKIINIIYCKHKGSLRKIYIESIILYLVFYVQHNIKKQTNQTNINLPICSDKIDLVKEYILNNLSESITISNISSLIGTNQSYLKQTFKKLTGQTISEFIRENRMNKAKNLLLNSDLTICEISYEVGYSSISSFSQAFKSFFKVNPSSFQKKITIN